MRPISLAQDKVAAHGGGLQSTLQAAELRSIPRRRLSPRGTHMLFQLGAASVQLSRGTL